MSKYTLDPVGIDCYIFAVEQSAFRLFTTNYNQPGYDYPFPLHSVADPLRWLIATGRMGAATLRTLLSIRPDVIARCLLKGGSDDEVIDRIYSKIDAKIC